MYLSSRASAGSNSDIHTIPSFSFHWGEGRHFTEQGFHPSLWSEGSEWICILPFDFISAFLRAAPTCKAEPGKADCVYWLLEGRTANCEHFAGG